MVFQQVDVGLGLHPMLQGGGQRLTGGVGGVRHPSVRVAAFPRKVQVAGSLGVPFLGEGHALLDQPVDALAALRYHQFDGVLVAQAGAGDQGIVDVGVDGVVRVQHRGNAALGVVGIAVLQRRLGQHGDAHGWG